MKKNIAFALAIFLLALSGTSQNEFNTWTSHTSCRQVISTDVTHGKVFCATPYDIFYYDTEDNSINRITKIDGLSDFGINAMRYCKDADVIFVGYSNTNIDLIYNDGNIFNISDIKDKSIIGNKTINDVYFIGTDAYVCCGFGIVVVDLQKKEIKDTYIIGENGSYINVNDIALYNDNLYAATSNGVYHAPIDSDNLADFEQWKHDNSMIHPSLNYSEIETFNGKLYANYSANVYNGDTLFVYNGNHWDYFDKNFVSIKREIKASEDYLMIANYYNVTIYDKNNAVAYNFYQNIEPLSVSFDGFNFWIGDAKSCLIKFNKNFERENISVSSPYSNKAFEIDAVGEKVVVASGGYRTDWSRMWNADGVFLYDNSTWSFRNRSNSGILDTISDLVCVAIDPANTSHFYAGSFDKGLIEFEDNNPVRVYNNNNSSLGSVLGYESMVYVSGLEFDSKHNLWALNSQTDKLLSVKESNGTWHSYDVGSGGAFTSHLIIDKNNFKWMAERYGTITVFNDNNTLSNTSDDQYKVIKNVAGQGGLPATANCMAVDSRGVVWVGTTDGVCMFTDTRKIFKSGVNYDATRILVPRNDGSGQADYLLSGESIRCIAVDGGDNLWYGTTNGAFHISNDGMTEHHHFTAENSPLFSNTINDIAIDANGNVYFVTDQGIISYKGDASEGQDTNSDVVVYPNPVRLSKSPYVGIRGLVKNSIVKITTVNGSFVTHLRADGGQAVWDCTTIDNQRVDHGIYLVFVSDETGTERQVSKVLVLE